MRKPLIVSAIALAVVVVGVVVWKLIDIARALLLLNDPNPSVDSSEKARVLATGVGAYFDLVLWGVAGFLLVGVATTVGVVIFFARRGKPRQGAGEAVHAGQAVHATEAAPGGPAAPGAASSPGIEVAAEADQQKPGTRH